MSAFKSPHRGAVLPFLLIALAVAILALAFVYTAGWLSPDRITADKIVSALAPPGGAALGHRRNHTKGICFTGVFEASGQGATLSSAPMLASGQYSAIGRFNIASSKLDVQDPTARGRGLGLQISAPDGQVWRMAINDVPFFPVATVPEFYELLTAAASKDSNAIKTFAAAHPEFAASVAWGKTAPWTASFADETYNSLDSFVFTNASNQKSVVRWSLQPVGKPVFVAPEELAARGPNFLEEDIAQRVKSGPVLMAMVVTVADAGDPTSDPSKAWPPGRRSLEVGTLIIRDVQPERNGPCRDINFDPTDLPAGIATSDDPFPAARSAAYRRSYDLRTAEEKSYPHTDAESSP